MTQVIKLSDGNEVYIESTGQIVLVVNPLNKVVGNRILKETHKVLTDRQFKNLIKKSVGCFSVVGGDV